LEIRALNRHPLLVNFTLAVITLFFMIGCHSKNHGSNESSKSTPEKVEFLSPSDLESGFSEQAVNKLKDVVENTMLPVATGENKKELSKIKKYLDEISNYGSSYFDSPKNFIEFLEVGGRVSVLLAKLNPDNFAANQNVSSYYINAGHSIEDLAQTEEDRQLGNKYQKIGIQAAQDLIKKFPKNGQSYAQFAFALSISGGDKKRIADLFKRCVELDSNSEYCKNSYNMILKEMSDSSRHD